MQARVYRNDKGTFDLVLTPRRRTGLVPIMIRNLTKEQVKAEVARVSDQETEILAVIRNAARNVPAP